jgi:hypothetical protein
LSSKLLHHEGTKDTKVTKANPDREVRMPGKNNKQKIRTGDKKKTGVITDILCVFFVTFVTFVVK